jgi:hypothetical protein
VFIMKKYLLVAASVAAIADPAFAYIPASSVTTMALPVYGVYTSSDPTCTTGLTATVALTKDPQELNFAENPTIGAGPIPSSIGCVVIVIGNSLSNGWAAGSYTTTSQGYSDSACDAGGSYTGQTICNSATIAWPSQITSDAAAVGLTLTTGSCTGSTSEVVPLVLSTDSVCTGQQTTDASVTACANGNVNNFTPPTTASDATQGTKLTSPSASGNLKFVVNPANTLGGESGNTCGNIAAPLFSFEDA